MKIELGPTLTLAGEKTRVFLTRLRSHRFWVQLVAVTILALFTLAIVGRSAYARAAALNIEAQRLVQAQEGLDRWSGMMVWPTPEETAVWRESETLFSRLGSTSVEPLSLAGQLATRGEEISGANVRIRMANPDTAFIPPEQRVGSWVMRSGRSALIVEMSSDWPSIISFLGALPPHLDPASMSYSTGESGPTMSLLLLSREIVQEQP